MDIFNVIDCLAIGFSLYAIALFAVVYEFIKYTLRILVLLSTFKSKRRGYACLKLDRIIPLCVLERGWVTVGVDTTLILAFLCGTAIFKKTNKNTKITRIVKSPKTIFPSNVSFFVIKIPPLF